MQQGMPGTGQCNKPGGKGKSPGKSLPQNADQLQKQIEAMKKYLKEKGNKKGVDKKVVDLNNLDEWLPNKLL